MTPDFHITQKISASDYRRYCNVCGIGAKKRQQKQEAIMLAIGLVIAAGGYSVLFLSFCFHAWLHVADYLPQSLPGKPDDLQGRAVVIL